MRYEFGEFQLDTDQYRLERAGTPVPIEPRVLELVAHLIARRGEVVSKEELHSAVWDGQIVSESALNRCVYEARRALDDHDKQLIVTVHGRGYRFDGEPEAIAAVQNVATNRATSSGRRRRSRVVAGLALVVLTALAFAWWKGSPAAGPSPEGAHPAFATTDSSPVRLALLPFDVEGDDADMQFLGLMLGDLLVSRLRTLEGLIVRPPEYAGSILTEVGSIEGLARQSGVSHVVAASLRRVRETGIARLEVVLHSFPRDGRPSTTTLGRFRVPLRIHSSVGGLDEFVRVRNAITAEVVARLAPAISISINDPLAPQDPVAYRLYLRARNRIEISHCEGGGATELLRRAIELDPEFALAWELMAVAQYNRVWACGAGAETYADARRSAQRASELAPELQTAGLIEVLILVETGALETAYERILELRDEHPEHPLVLVAEAYVLRYAGYLEHSESRLREALAIDPLVMAADPSGNAPNALLYQNELDEYLALIPSTDSPYHRFYRGFAEYLRGNREIARAVLEPAFRSNPSDLFARFSHAMLAIMDEEPEAALAILREISRQREHLDATDGEITYKQAQLLVLAGDEEGAMTELDSAIAQGFFPVPYFRIDPVLEPVRNLPAFKAALAAASRRHETFGTRFEDTLRKE